MSAICTNLRASAIARLLDDSSPGPAAHVPRIHGTTAPRTVIGTASRSPKSPRGSAPGPADYPGAAATTVMGLHLQESRIASVPALGFPRAARSPGRATDLGPGPAAYEPATTILPRAPAFAFGTDARLSSPAKEGPGPGAYGAAGDTHISTHASPPRYSMPRSPRSGGAKADTPGPGSYAVEGSRGDGTRPSSARVIFGHAARPASASSLSPGPAYSPGMGFVLPSPPAFSWSRAPRGGAEAAPGSASAAAAAALPGPQSYVVTTIPGSPTSPRTVIGSASRFRQAGVEGVPGPGTYVSLDGRLHIPGGAIGKSPRPESAPSSPRSPGPGAYGSNASPTSPGESRIVGGAMARDARFESGAHSAARAASPAPNAYDAGMALDRLRPSSAQHRIGRAERTMSAGRGGGADTLYAPSIDFVKPASPRSPFSKASRVGSGDASPVPGPADYAVRLAPVLPAAPAFTMRAR